SFSFHADPQAQRMGQIFIRFTGRADHKRLAKFIGDTRQNSTTKEEKGPKGEPITRISAGNEPPVITLIGDSDLFMVGHERNNGNNGDHDALMQSVLDVIAGRKPSLLTGPLAAPLKEVSPQAIALFGGELPDDVRRSLAGGGIASW